MFRDARATDAAAVAALHAESWRRHYRGAYADSFLDGDVLADRRDFWAVRLSEAGAVSFQLTIIAEDPEPVGFVHVAIAADERFGALVDNLHVAHDRQRHGIGARLMRLAAEALVEARHDEAVYLWALEQNLAARAFYEAIGGRRAEAASVEPPGGVKGRLVGTPRKLRYVWESAKALRAGAGKQA